MVGVVHKHLVGVALRKKVDAPVIDEIGSSTIMGCGFVLIKAGDRRPEQEEQSPTAPAPVHRRDQGVPSAAFDQDLRDDLSALQRELNEEKELNAKRHAALLALFQALQPKPPAS